MKIRLAIVEQVQLGISPQSIVFNVGGFVSPEEAEYLMEYEREYEKEKPQQIKEMK